MEALESFIEWSDISFRAACFSAGIEAVSYRVAASWIAERCEVNRETGGSKGVDPDILPRSKNNNPTIILDTFEIVYIPGYHSLSTFIGICQKHLDTRFIPTLPASGASAAKRPAPYSVSRNFRVSVGTRSPMHRKID